MKRCKKGLLISIGAMMVLTGCTAKNTSNASGGSQSKTTDSAKTEERTLTRIAVTTQPTKTDYTEGEKFDPTGMVVTAYYSDNTDEAVKDYTIDKTGELTTYDKQITISYKGQKATVSITVKIIFKLDTIRIEENPTKMNYVVGEVFDPAGMKVTASFTDGTTKVITDYTVDKTKELALNDTTITVSYTFENVTKRATLTITIVEETVEGIEVTTQPTKMSYLVGETFDPTGMVVSTIKNNRKKEAVTDYTYDKKGALTIEDTKVNITYKTWSTVLNISVSEAKLTGITITAQPKKTSYYIGETFDPTGMVVTATYENNTRKEVTDYAIDKTGKLQESDTEVTVSYGGFTAKVAITVEKKYDVKISGLETYRVEAEDLDTSKAFLREDFKQAKRGFIEEGDGASGGKNICGYNPGSVFEISLYVEENATVYIDSSMSDTNTTYDLKDGMKFEMDTAVLTPSDVKFTYSGGNSYWEWKDVNFGTISLAKGEHTFRITSLSQRPNLDYFQFEVLQYGDQSVENKVTGIEITALPTKTVYEEGEIFDPTGMVVTATYSTHEKKVITDYTYDKHDPLTMADDKVTISYNGLITTVSITVGEKVDLRIGSLGDHYFEAEDFDTSKFIERDDMAAQIAQSGYVVSSSDSHNGKSIERYANGSVMSLSFYVGKASVSNLTIVASNYENFTWDDGVNVKLDDATLESNNPVFGHRNPSDWYNWQNVVYSDLSLSEGKHTLTITMVKSVPNLDCLNFHVTKYGDEVETDNLSSIEVTALPTKTTYLVGERFDPSGMVISAVYSSGKKEAVTDYTYDKKEALAETDTSVTITYQGKTAIVPITVKNSDMIVTEASSFTMEAEDFDTSHLIGDGSNFVESDSRDSNGKSLGHISSGYVDLVIVTNGEYRLSVTGAFSKYENIFLAASVSFSLDGTDVSFEDITLGRAEDGTNDWFNWKRVTLDCGTLTEGAHTFRLTYKGGINTDYLKFDFTK